MKTKTITLKIKIPANYKWLAYQNYGEISIFKEKPVIVEPGEDDLFDNATYWDLQKSSICVLGSGELMELNKPKDFKKTLRKI